MNNQVEQPYWTRLRERSKWVLLAICLPFVLALTVSLVSGDDVFGSVLVYLCLTLIWIGLPLSFGLAAFVLRIDCQASGPISIKLCSAGSSAAESDSDAISAGTASRADSPKSPSAVPACLRRSEVVGRWVLQGSSLPILSERRGWVFVKSVKR